MAPQFLTKPLPAATRWPLSPLSPFLSFSLPSSSPSSPCFSQKRGDTKFYTALGLSIFFGAFGIDRFYLGYPGIGLLKLTTCGFFLIGYYVDIFLIATQVCFLGPSFVTVSQTPQQILHLDCRTGGRDLLPDPSERGPPLQGGGHRCYISGPHVLVLAQGALPNHLCTNTVFKLHSENTPPPPFWEGPLHA